MSRKKTLHEHWLSGNAGHRHPLTAKPPAKEASAPTAVPASSRPRCPAHLGPEAKQEFRRLSKILGARRWEDEGTFVVLSVYAECYSRWIECKRVLGAEGIRITVEVADSHGVVRSKIVNHPLLPILADLERRLVALAREMGLSPSSRSKVEPLGAPDAPKNLTQDEADELAYQQWLREPQNQGAQNAN